ncbi:MAG TPA: sugar transferase [Streptosporangiaceae bacterium]|nr:sugar transferase [Streptosporangiaceae bacterium]
MRGRTAVAERGEFALPPLRTEVVVPVGVGVDPASWTGRYLRGVVAADCLCALAAGVVALLVRFDGEPHLPAGYLASTLILPVIWVFAAAFSGAYDARFIGVGSDEFRRVLNAAVSLTAAVAIIAYATQTQVARGYVVIALPSATVLDLSARYWLRKRLHRLRGAGLCMHKAVAVGHREAVDSLISELRRARHHGLDIVAVCLPDGRLSCQEVEGVTVYGNLSDVTSAVRLSGADTVAVLGCPEMDGLRLRRLAWDLEKTGTDLCVAPALMDVAGPRTTIRPVAGLPLLHVDHPELAGARRVMKALFDKTAAAAGLIALAPLFAAIALAIRFREGGPVLFRQTRVGKDGRTFTVYKFRTMVVDAEERKGLLTTRNEHDGVLFKIRSDPRITRTGAWLRRHSLDELPQLFNVLLGDMSLVGPRPPLPAEAAKYGDYVRRRLVVKPGLTGLWQVNGRSDLSWEESVRLDLRYVENWSFALDLQILWKTGSAVARGSGAY